MLWFSIITLFCERLICVGFSLTSSTLTVKFFFSDRPPLSVTWTLMSMAGLFSKSITASSTNKLYFTVNWEYKVYIELSLSLSFNCLWQLTTKILLHLQTLLCSSPNGETERWVKFSGKSKGNSVGLNTFSYRKLSLCAQTELLTRVSQQCEGMCIPSIWVWNQEHGDHLALGILLDRQVCTAGPNVLPST